MVEGLARTGETCGIPQVKMLVADQLEDIGWQREQAKDGSLAGVLSWKESHESQTMNKLKFLNKLI